MSELHENEKTAVVTESQPQSALPEVLQGEKNEQVLAVAESTESSDRGQEQQEEEGQQKGRFARLFTYVKTRDFWILLVLG
jgi:solute carrier family 35, member F1/2